MPINQFIEAQQLVRKTAERVVYLWLSGSLGIPTQIEHSNSYALCKLSNAINAMDCAKAFIYEHGIINYTRRRLKGYCQIARAARQVIVALREGKLTKKNKTTREQVLNRLHLTLIKFSEIDQEVKTNTSSIKYGVVKKQGQSFIIH